MTGGRIRALAGTVGVATMLGAGALAGGLWWVVAVVGAVGAAGAVRDRQFAYLQALALLGAVVGLAAVGHHWFVPLLVAGTFASIELGAAADRTTVIRRSVPDLSTVGTRVAGAALLGAAVLLLSQLPVPAMTAAVLLAAGAAVVATRVIAR